MHVTPFSGATILVFAIASPLHAQGIEVFGGYSVNADYVQNRPAIPVIDRRCHPSSALGAARPASRRRSNTMCGTVSASKSMYLIIPIHSHQGPRRTANRTAPLPGLPAAPA